MITLMLQIICLWVRKVMIGVHYHFPGSLHFVAWTHFTQCCELHYTLHSTDGQNMRILPRTNCVERSPCSQFAHKRTLQCTEAAPGPSAPAILYTAVLAFFCNYMQSRKVGIIHRPMCAFFRQRTELFRQCWIWCLVHNWMTHLCV